MRNDEGGDGACGHVATFGCGPVVFGLDEKRADEADGGLGVGEIPDDVVRRLISRLSDSNGLEQISSHHVTAKPCLSRWGDYLLKCSR